MNCLISHDAKKLKFKHTIPVNIPMIIIGHNI